jgi:hypothetical protein
MVDNARDTHVTYFVDSTPSFVLRFWQSPFGRHSSLVSPFAALPPAGLVLLVAQHIVDGPPDVHGCMPLKKPLSCGSFEPSGA